MSTGGKVGRNRLPIGQDELPVNTPTTPSLYSQQVGDSDDVRMRDDWYVFLIRIRNAPHSDALIRSFFSSYRASSSSSSSSYAYVPDSLAIVQSDFA